MYETTVTFTKQNEGEDFFIFSILDKELLFSHNLYRNAIVNTPGFISMSYALSDDKMQLKVITLWESHAAALKYKNPHAKRYHAALNNYKDRTGVYSEVSYATLPDTEVIKAKKFSSRLTVEEASQELKEHFTTKQKIMEDAESNFAESYARVLVNEQTENDTSNDADDINKM